LFQIADLEANGETLQRERDFYFDKLREVEILCQEATDDSAEEKVKELKERVLEILYRSGDGFSPPVDCEETNGAGDNGYEAGEYYH